VSRQAHNLRCRTALSRERLFNGFLIILKTSRPRFTLTHKHSGKIKMLSQRVIRCDFKWLLESKRQFIFRRHPPHPVFSDGKLQNTPLAVALTAWPQPCQHKARCSMIETSRLSYPLALNRFCLWFTKRTSATSYQAKEIMPFSHPPH